MEQKYSNGLSFTQTNSARNLTITNAGKILLAGFTYCFGADMHSAIIVEVDSATGNRNWTKTYGSTDNDGFNGIFNTNDGNIICSASARLDGSINTKYWVAIVNTKGDTLWQRSYSQNASNAYSGSISNAEDDGYVALLNETNASGSMLCNMMRLNNQGYPVWTRIFDRVNFEALNTVLTTSDNNYIAMGQTNSFGNGGYDIFIAKLDKDGNIASCCVRNSNVLIAHGKPTAI